MTTAQITSQNQAVQWMINHAQKTSTANGVEGNIQWTQNEGWFSGQLPSGMVSKLNAYVKAVASHRGSNSQSAYNWTEGDVTFTIKQGAFVSTKNGIDFQYCETITVEKPQDSITALRKFFAQLSK